MVSDCLHAWVGGWMREKVDTGAAQVCVLGGLFLFVPVVSDGTDGDAFVLYQYVFVCEEAPRIRAITSREPWVKAM